MGTSKRAIAALTVCALASGCFGYNKSAKRWAYVGDTILLLGGAAAIGADFASKGPKCMETTIVKCEYEPPISGNLVAGALLVGAGIFGYLFNATRDNVKTSR